MSNNNYIKLINREEKWYDNGGHLVDHKIVPGSWPIYISTFEGVICDTKHPGDEWKGQDIDTVISRYQELIMKHELVGELTIDRSSKTELDLSKVAFVVQKIDLKHGQWIATAKTIAYGFDPITMRQVGAVNSGAYIDSLLNCGANLQFVMHPAITRINVEIHMGKSENE